VVIFRRVFLTVATIAISAVTATPSMATTDGPSIPWASLGVVRPLLIQPAGWGSPIAAQPGSATYAWCSKKGVEIAAGSDKTILVPDSSVEPMLSRSHLGLPSLSGGSKVVVTCENIALDPSHPKTVYAGFQASHGESIPPAYDVALVTSNLGKSWRFVPPPRGYSLTDFAGFDERLGGVALLYSRNYFFPLKTGQTASFVAASSSTGGHSWTDLRLGCTASKTCVIFGPESPQGACGMSEWQQSVLVVASGQGTTTTRWRSAGAVSSVSQCGSQQLVATTSGDEFLIDRSRPDALLYTRNGINWTTVSLPKIDGAPVGGTFAPFGQVMTITANGVLIAVSGSPLEAAEHLEILKPDSNAWCAASAPLPTATKQNPVVAMQSSDSRLVVTFLAPIRTDRGTETSALSFPLSNLHCGI
jgi:hypothetical protein